MSTRSQLRLRLLARTCFFNLFLLAPVATAGQELSASIIGQVRDESGSILPGVTVTAKSPALQVQQLMGITDERGEYRLTPLPIGTYTVTYELAGFQTVRQEDLRLTVGFAAKVDKVLKVGALAETITVSGTTPVVDVTGTGTTTQLTRETLELLPTSRNGFTALLAQAPGVRGFIDVGGSSTVNPPTNRSFGQGGDPNYYIEGVFTSHSAYAGGATEYWDYSSIDEASVQTVGNGASVAQPGLSLNMIVKSGGNDYHGTGWWSETGAALQSDNITPALRAQGIRSGGKLTGRYDLSGDLGGRILRDKLWFYGGLRKRAQHIELLDAFKDDGSPATTDSVAWHHTEKLSYQMTPGNRFVAFSTRTVKDDVGRATDNLTAWETRPELIGHPYTGKIEWQATVGSSLFISLQYGNYHSWTNYPAHSNAPPQRDVATQKVWGVYTQTAILGSNGRHDPKGTVTWYRPNLFYGNHQFTAGFGAMYNRQARGSISDPPYTYGLIFNNGAPFQMNVYNYPNKPTTFSEVVSGYASDSWTMGRRLTLNLGLRYSRDDPFIQEACRDTATAPGNLAFPAACYPRLQWKAFSSVAPRVHAAYDLTGGGRTVLKGGWGRFDNMRKLDGEVSLTDPQVNGNATYSWHDRNGNNDYDAGEVNLDPNGPDYLSQTAGAIFVSNPNEKQPKNDEFSLSFEHELAKNLAFRIVGVYSRTLNTYRVQNNLRPYEAYNITITRPDPGPDGTVDTFDDPGALITYYEFPSTLAGQKFEQYTFTNDPKADQTYKSIEIAGFKRLSSGWQFMASYSATKVNVPIVNGLVQIEGNSAVRAGDKTPNAEINAANRTWEWTGKASGSYTLPYGLSVSGNLEYRSGVPWGRQVLFVGGRTIPSIVLNVEPIGTRRLPNISLLDARIEKNFRLVHGQRAAVRLNIYNVLNASPVTTLNMRSGTTFLRPLSILPPRIAEFSASYTF